MINTPAVALSILKGMPLTVLVAMLCIDLLPTSEAEIAAMIGVNAKTVRTHLNFLMTHGLVVRGGRFGGWNITDGARKLPLPLGFDKDENLLSSGKSYLSSPSSSSSSSIEGNFDFLEEKGEEAKMSGKSYRSTELERFGKARKEAQARGLVQAFQDSGIGMNMWEELAGYEWVDAEYVRGHTAVSRARGEPIGYVIQRMRCCEAVPEMDGCPAHGREYWHGGVCLRCSGLIKG